mmetsp:Transcript_4188/g.4842  ORF Transcript_4188/g.4842 Transcript_4188/m.4842 type:complete len:288 (+) Transcript_4188:348-1211(+)|eukprot:CAMPEP_0197850288 /NCGR_PEP_ID=MMETSP1438-20131217/14895_1 /TAXON_ID=1461541 /ORGANISM="Pterosperma sp., Strain CCMP1384" /LENGTH=287 /DNA_ID=CAMNT_0043463373 /DNA_START=330 /DNA_END=1193 /DNA_ORIENTATION=+
MADENAEPEEAQVANNKDVTELRTASPDMSSGKLSPQLEATLQADAIWRPRIGSDPEERARTASDSECRGSRVGSDPEWRSRTGDAKNRSRFRSAPKWRWKSGSDRGSGEDNRSRSGSDPAEWRTSSDLAWRSKAEVDAANAEAKAKKEAKKDKKTAKEKPPKDPNSTFATPEKAEKTEKVQKTEEDTSHDWEVKLAGADEVTKRVSLLQTLTLQLEKETATKDEQLSEFRDQLDALTQKTRELEELNLQAVSKAQAQSDQIFKLNCCFAAFAIVVFLREITRGTIG